MCSDLSSSWRELADQLSSNEFSLLDDRFDCGVGQIGWIPVFAQYPFDHAAQIGPGLLADRPVDRRVVAYRFGHFAGNYPELAIPEDIDRRFVFTERIVKGEFS